MLILWGALYAPFVLPYFLYWTQAELLSRPQGQLFIEIAAATTMLLAAWALTRYIDRHALSRIGFTLRGMLSNMVLGTAVGFALTGFVLLTLFSFGWLLLYNEGEVSLAPLLWAAILLLLNTLTQEILIRGYMLPVLRVRFGTVSAILVSSVLFLAIHAGVLNGDEYLPMLNIFLAGVLLGVAFVVSGSIWLPVGIHFGWNYLQGPVLGLSVTGQDIGNGWQLAKLNGPSIYSGGSFGLEGSIVATLIICLGILGLIIAKAASWKARDRYKIQPARSLA